VAFYAPPKSRKSRSARRVNTESELALVEAALRDIERKTRKSKASWITTIAVLVIVALCGLFFEEFKEWFPWLTTWQMRAYNLLSHLEARKPRPKFVVGVEIDDETFFKVMHLASGAPTDRHGLAEIIRRLSRFHPAVIAVDIKLPRQSVDDSQPRKAANMELLSAIRDTVANRVPVVLTRSTSAEGTYPNFVPDESLPEFVNLGNPYRTRVGFDRAAEDLRKVPLAIIRRSPEGTPRTYNSFALEVAEAYEDAVHITPRTSDRLKSQISKHRFVFTNFLPQEQFHMCLRAPYYRTMRTNHYINWRTASL
jgi:CHASE2 domain-containing sensor protein